MKSKQAKKPNLVSAGAEIDRTPHKDSVGDSGPNLGDPGSCLVRITLHSANLIAM